MSLLRGFLLLTGFYLLGESLAFVLDWPVSGGVVGMILMTLFLMVRGRVNKDLGMASQSLIAFLTMLIMPGVVGIYFLGEELAGQWLAIAGSLVVGTLLSVLTTLWLMARFMPTPQESPHD